MSFLNRSNQVRSSQGVKLYYTILYYTILFLPLSSLTSTAEAVGISFEADQTLAKSEEEPTKDKIQLAESYGKLPIAFEANDGQTDPEVKYFARGQGYTLFMTPQEFVLSMTTSEKKLSKNNLHSPKSVLSKGKIKTASVRIKFINPNADAKTITGINELQGKSNYFIGNDPQKWRTNVPTYEKVEYEKIYDGIDLVVYGNQRQIEYDFVVEPHADYKQIALKVEGMEKLRVDKDGNLIIASKDGKMLMHKPLIYQEIDGVKQEIKGRYQVDKGNLVSFNVAGYDKSKALVIDPMLAYSTYLGGSGSASANGIAVDSTGNAYVTGITNATDFPITTQTTGSAFITKLNTTGTALVYSTYLAGRGSVYELTTGIAVDSTGNAYVVGGNPVGYCNGNMIDRHTVFIAKLNSTGTAIISSQQFCIDTGDDYSTGIAIDFSGNAYMVGSTNSNDFPVTTGAFQTTLKSSQGNAFIAKLQFSSGSSDYDAAVAAMNSMYAQYASWLGTPSGSAATETTTNGTYYVQWFTNGAALVAWTDGYMYIYYGGGWYFTGSAWKSGNGSTAAITMIDTVYSEYSSWFGSKSGSITTGTATSGTYYVQWFTNGAALVAWSDGAMYTYYNGAWYSLGVSWI